MKFIREAVPWINEEVLEKQERRIVKNLQVKTKSIYDDYDETKIGSKQYIMSQALRYLELVSKILPILINILYLLSDNL